MPYTEAQKKELARIKKNIFDSQYGESSEKAQRNVERGKRQARNKLLKEHPFADPDKFEFIVTLTKTGDTESVSTMYKVNDRQSFDITSETFKTKYSDALEWGPHIWNGQKSKKVFALTKNTTLPYHLTKFNIYVTENDYFESNFEALDTVWKNTSNVKDITKAKFDTYDPYFTSLLAAYVISQKSGSFLRLLSHETVS